MTRLRPDYVIQLITGLRRDLDARKTAQLTGGDSLIGNLTYSGNLNDWNSGAISGTGTTQKYVLTFTPAASTSPPVVQLFLFYAIDNTDVLSHYVPPWANGPSLQLVLQPLPPSGSNLQWAFSITNADVGGSPHTAYLYLIFSGIDTGTWSITAY